MNESHDTREAVPGIRVNYVLTPLGHPAMASLGCDAEPHSHRFRVLSFARLPYGASQHTGNEDAFDTLQNLRRAIRHFCDALLLGPHPSLRNGMCAPAQKASRCSRTT